MSGELQGKKILLGVTGGIAAYKSVFLAAPAQGGGRRRQGRHDRSGDSVRRTTDVRNPFRTSGPHPHVPQRGLWRRHLAGRAYRLGEVAGRLPSSRR